MLGPVGFGGAAIGNLYSAVDDDTAAAAVHGAWEAGIRYFDTAPHYGLGLSERRLGAALARYPRDGFVVSTKVGRLLVPHPHPTDRDPEFDVPGVLTRRWDFSADGVRRSVAESLERLGMDRIDIALVHDPDDHMEQALAEAVPALAAMPEVGVVGVGMNVVEPLLRFVEESTVDAVMVAGRWTLADRSAAPLLEACSRRGVSVLAAAPFNSGLLAAAWPADDAFFDYAPAPAPVLARARRMAAACERGGASLPQAAMQFPLRHEAVASVVVGIRTAGQALVDVAWAADPVPGPVWTELDAVY
ncbi:MULTISPECIES: aldo/keto reductase [unclassified Pseudonocardia]|uniref:aldo/keto reductase n=1 Tax=unclassified Pseudonocardia TaxID=2619320 RepID=UPI0025D0C55C|nr:MULTISPECIES: aldo/keto reductase [unclassified Pseudonocardia]